MQHADEGSLNAYLDGELTPAEVVELERHLSVCAPCRAKLAEVKSFFGEADELVTLLDHVPPGTKASATAPKAVRPRVLRPATIAWAASVVLAAGIGYAWHEETAVPSAPSALAENTQVATYPAPALAQPTAPSTAGASVAVPPRETARRDAPPPTPAASTPTPLAAAEVAGQTTSPPRPEQDLAASGAVALSAGIVSKSTTSDRGADNVAYIDGVPVDTAAARQRQLLAFGPAKTPEPKRITIDEAVDLLGGSIQLIDGLTPQRVELLAGVDVTGADPARQVVRVYYEEPDLGLVTLDQQRPGPSFDSRRPESPAAIPPVSVAPAMPQSDAMARAYRAPVNNVTWRADGVWLSLTTRLTKERMAALQARVK